MCYEDPPEIEGGNEGGPPQWKMEFPGGATPGLGIPQSQILDSGRRDDPPHTIRGAIIYIVVIMIR